MKARLAPFSWVWRGFYFVRALLMLCPLLLPQMSANQARGWRRLACLIHLATPGPKPMLVPVAVPADAAYLQMTAEAIMAFNKRG